jgi:hypothetical protein
MEPFFGGMPPAVAPEGDLVFRGKPSRPLALLIKWKFTFVHPTGELAIYITKETWKSFLRVKAT